MRLNTTNDPRANRAFLNRAPLGALGALGVSLVLAGCSSVPDVVNPIEWYKSTADFFSSDEPIGTQETVTGDEQNDQAETAASDIPSINDVPSGLGATTDEGRYASQPIARQSAPANALSATTDEAPAPPATPMIAVTPVPVAPMTTVAEVAPALPPMPEREMPETMTPPATSSLLAMESGEMPPAPPQLPSANYQTLSDAGLYETVVISGEGVDMASSDGGVGQLPRTTSAGGPMFPPANADMPSQVSQPTLMDGAIRVATIRFANGSAELDERDRAILAAVKQIQAERGGYVRIVGHASSRTATMPIMQHKMVNFEVSAARADVVARELVRQGASQDNVSVVAVSDTQPLYFEMMPSGEAGNRRVEIYLVP